MLGNAAGKSELGRVELAEAEPFHKVTWEPERPEPAVGQVWNIPAFDGRAREHTIATIHDNPGGEEGPIIYWGEGGGANLVSDLTCETSSWEFVSHPELKSKILRDNLEVGENDYPPLVYPTKLIEPEPRRGFHWDDDTEALRQRLADGDTSIGWGTVTAERDMERYDTDPATGRMSYTPGDREAGAAGKEYPYMGHTHTFTNKTLTSEVCPKNTVYVLPEGTWYSKIPKISEL
jgi:hypothetical protein